MTGSGNMLGQGRIRIVLVTKEQRDHDPIEEIIHAADDMQIIGVAKGMQSGLEMVRALQPEIVLVQNIPEIVDFTSQVRIISNTTGVILLSAASDPVGPQFIVDALAAGAFDVVKTVDKNNSGSNLLLSKIRCCSIKQYSHQARNGRSAELEVKQTSYTFSKAMSSKKYDAVVVGVSTGGPEALLELLPGIPASFPIPIIIVLHMPKEFTGAMALALNRKCKIEVTEAKEGEEALAGHAYIAPGGRHCMIERAEHNRLQFKLGDGPPENGCRPSVDVLFRSAVSTLGKRGITVMLTGMGSDGAIGAGAMKHCGSPILVQDELSSVVWGMPGSVVRGGFADEILPLKNIASRICELVGAA